MNKVIIGMTTYNLEDYVSEAVESVLSQKTSFDYKLVVADDCSTDGTLEILNSYKKQFPDKLEILTSDKNLGSLSNSNRLFDGVKCDYISFLDGDDYWIGNDRLQKQVDFMEQHSECSIYAGNTYYMNNGIFNGLVASPKKLDKFYTFDDFMNGNIPFFHTSSILLRNKIFINGIPNVYKKAVGTFEDCALRGEDFRRILHLTQGKLYASNEIISVYRIHSRGLWQGSTEIRRLLETAITANFYKKYFGDKYGSYFSEYANETFRNLIMFMFASNLMTSTGYFLNAKDSFLFTGLLNDMASKNFEIINTKPNKIRMKFFRILSRFFRIKKRIYEKFSCKIKN